MQIRPKWSDDPRIEALLQEVRKFGASHPLLRGAHHFLFGLPHPNSMEVDRVEFIVMGLNPGETRACHQISVGPGNEESMRFDYQLSSPRGMTRGRRRWFNRVEEMLGNRSAVMTEICFWSSRNQADLERIYGKLSAENEIYKFCASTNRSLISILKPRAVVFPGLTAIPMVREFFQMTPVERLRCSTTGHRLVESFCDRSGMAWHFTKHWSGARGFTRDQRASIRGFLANSCKLAA